MQTSPDAVAPRMIDARGLEPPEPLLRILSAVETLRPGETLRAHTDRKPLHLLAELAARGLPVENTALPDGTWITHIGRP